MMAADTHDLIEKWAARGNRPLDADALLHRSPTRGTHRAARRNHQWPTPYGRLAFEYEIEQLSITAGARLLENIAAVCGADRVAGLTFLTHHIELDEGCTEFNRRQLDALLSDHPEFVDNLVHAGSSATHAYRQFLYDCLDEARAALSVA